MSTQTATRKPTEIQQAVVHRCTCKETHEVFYVIRSDSDPNTWYQIRWDVNGWRCNCPATKPCKHERAVTQVLAAKQALNREAKQAEAAQVAEGEQVEPAHETVATTEQVGNLDEQVVKQEIAKAEKFLALYSRYDHRSVPAKVAPKTEQVYVPIAERGNLNGSRAFSLMKR